MSPIQDFPSFKDQFSKAHPPRVWQDWSRWSGALRLATWALVFLSFVVNSKIPAQKWGLITLLYITFLLNAGLLVAHMVYERRARHAYREYLGTFSPALRQAALNASEKDGFTLRLIEKSLQ